MPRSICLVFVVLAACARPPVRAVANGSSGAGAQPAPQAPEPALAAPTAPQTHVAVSGLGTTRSAVAVHDERACAGKPGEVCMRTTDANADKGGLSLHVEEERARAVTVPRTGATTTGASLSMIFGTGENVSLAGFNLGVNARYLTGGTFPGTSGGTWLGLFAQPQATIGLTKVETQTPRTCIAGRCSGGTTDSSTSGVLTLGVSAGVQWLSFGEQDAQSLQQEGWGIHAGAQAGTFVPLGEGDSTMTFGPAFGFSKQKYNPGTGSFDLRTFDFMILPSSSFLFVLFGVGANEG